MVVQSSKSGHLEAKGLQILKPLGVTEPGGAVFDGYTGVVCSSFLLAAVSAPSSRERAITTCAGGTRVFGCRYPENVQITYLA